MSSRRPSFGSPPPRRPSGARKPTSSAWWPTAATTCCAGATPPSSSPPTLVSDEEERTLEAEARRLGTLLDRLPAEQAEVIRLHTFASMRFTEIAETLELPASTVKSRFHYGIERLKTLL